MTQPVSYAREGAIGLICIDNPPVNATSQAVRAGLDAALVALAADTEARAAVIFCAGRTFIAGADIREFGKPPLAPHLPDVIARIEASDKPVVAVLHGTALGGGLEVALGAHYRIALPGTRLGLPEVTLGLMPGAGGTQRLPRLTGTEAAVEVITSARQVGAEEALRLGILDAIGTGSDPRAAGIAFAQSLLAEGKGPRPTGGLPPAAPLGESALADWRKRLSRAHPGDVARPEALAAVQDAATMSLAEGLAAERARFLRLMQTPQRAALVHAFLAEREVARQPDLEGVAPRAFDRIGVIGGGTMGAGIAVACLLAGLDVTLVERDAEAAAKARDSVTGLLSGSVKRGKLAPERRDAILADTFRAVDNYEALARADLVIEAVFEKLEVKREVFTRLDAVCRPGAVLATNTSYLDIDEIAGFTARPGDVVGLHFFSPAHVMRLLEIVEGARTAPEVMATAFALARRLKKIGVRAGVCDGFIGNRMLQAYRTAADHMVLDGASPYQVDEALTDFGFAMGPYQTSDLAGLDIGFFNRQRKAATRDPRERVPVFADRLYELGRLGRKSARGYYIYDDATPRGRPDPEMEGMLASIRADLGITPRAFTDQEIVARYMAAMVNEAARIVEEGIARRPLDVDVTALNGYGFPRLRGGPMHWADAYGLDRLAGEIRTYAEEDGWFWRPAPLLERLAREGGRFADLNR